MLGFVLGFLLFVIALFAFRWRNRSNKLILDEKQTSATMIQAIILGKDLLIGFVMGGIGIVVANIIAISLNRPDAIPEAISLLKIVAQGGSATKQLAGNKDAFTDSLVVIGGVGLAAAFAFLASVWVAGTRAIVTVSVAASVVVAYFIGNFIALLFLFIYLFLPLLNAFFDYPSWWITRSLIVRLTKDTKKAKGADIFQGVSKHIAIDILCALVFLIGLATSFALLANLAGMPGVWSRASIFAGENPFSSNGLMLTIMLLSTLFPTFIHLLFAVLALSTYLRPARLWIAKFLTPEFGGGEALSRTIVSTYLTMCTLVALVILWMLTVGLVKVADSMLRVKTQ